MASNRRSEAEARDESSEEEENEDAEASESEDEDKHPTPMSKKPSAPKKPETSKKPQPSWSGSESDSESPPKPPRRAYPNIKPIVSKPMEESPKATKKPRSKPSLATPAVKPSTAVKRAVEGDNDRSLDKKAKIKAVDSDNTAAKTTGDDAKKQLFQRIWSEDDEIVILKGMAEYTAKKGADPMADVNDFHDFIKKSLHLDVNKTQLMDKVRRLRKKYVNNVGKGKNGEDRSFSKPHEQKAYELSKKVWGSEGNGVGVDITNVNGKSRKNQTQKADLAMPKLDGLASPEKAKEGKRMEVELNTGGSEPVRFNKSIGELGLEEEIIKDGWEMISGAKKLELEEKWKQLRLLEIELYLKRLDLIREQTKLVLEALKPSGH